MVIIIDICLPCKYTNSLLDSRLSKPYFDKLFIKRDVEMKKNTTYCLIISCIFIWEFGKRPFGELAIWSPHHYPGILFDGVSLP